MLPFFVMLRTRNHFKKIHRKARTNLWFSGDQVSKTLADRNLRSPLNIRNSSATGFRLLYAFEITRSNFAGSAGLYSVY